VGGYGTRNMGNGLPEKFSNPILELPHMLEEKFWDVTHEFFPEERHEPPPPPENGW
jgi:hypothetical protein